MARGAHAVTCSGHSLSLLCSIPPGDYNIIFKFNISISTLILIFNNEHAFYEYSEFQNLGYCHLKNYLRTIIINTSICCQSSTKTSAPTRSQRAQGPRMVSMKCAPAELNRLQGQKTCRSSFHFNGAQRHSQATHMLPRTHPGRACGTDKTLQTQPASPRECARMPSFLSLTEVNRDANGPYWCHYRTTLTLP